MRHFSALILALSLFGCDDDTIILGSNERTETVMIAVNSNGEVFLSTGESPVTFQELPGEIEGLLNSENEYSFVIQAADSGGAHAKEIEKILHSQGVKDRHIAIAKAPP